MSNVMKAVQRLAGQAATAVQDDDNEQLKRLQQAAEAQKQQQLSNQWSSQALTGTLSNTTTTFANTPTWYTYAAQLGGSGTIVPATNITYNIPTAKPTIEFTPDQMTSFMTKLVDLLTRGWECLRRHRIRSPQVTGCEFCNFIDRLEGKDVERDDPA